MNHAYKLCNGLYYLSSQQIAFIKVKNKLIDVVKVAIVAFLLIGANSDASATDKQYFSVPGGTIYYDPQGGQHFYEGMGGSQVGGYQASYWDAFLNAAKTSAGLLGMVVAMTGGANPAGALLTPSSSYLSGVVLPVGAGPQMDSNIAAHMMFWIGLMTFAVGIENHVYMARDYAFSGEEDDRNTFAIVATSEQGISPLLLQQVFYAGSPVRFYYRVSAPNIIEEEKTLLQTFGSMIYSVLSFSEPESIFDESNPLVNRLVAALRQRNVFMDLETIGGVDKPRKLMVVFHDLEQKQLPITLIYKATEGMEWLEGLLAKQFHRSYLLRKFGNYSGLEEDIRGNSSIQGFQLPTTKLESPLSPDWLQLVVEWLEDESNWIYPKSQASSQEIFTGLAGPEYKEVCPAEGICATHSLPTEADEHGCLAFDLNGLTYYLPADLRVPDSTASETHCAALLPESTGKFALQTRTASNLRESYRKMYFDRMGKDLALMTTFALFRKAAWHMSQQSVASVGTYTPPHEAITAGDKVVPLLAPVSSRAAPATTGPLAAQTMASVPAVIPLVHVTGNVPFYMEGDISTIVDTRKVVTAYDLARQQMDKKTAWTAAVPKVETVSAATSLGELSEKEPKPDALLNEDQLSPVESSPSSVSSEEGDIVTPICECEDDTINIASSDVSALSTRPEPGVQRHGDFTLKIKQVRNPDRFKPSGYEGNRKEFRNIGRVEAPQMTVVGFLVNKDWELLQERRDPEPLKWTELVETVVRPEFLRLQLHRLSERKLDPVHRVFVRAMEVHPKHLRSAARHMVIRLIAESKVEEKFISDNDEKTGVYAGFTDTATARIAAAVVSLNSEKEEPFGSYRSFYSGGLKKLRMFSPFEQTNIIARNQVLFDLVMKYVHERPGQPIDDFELKSIALGSWPQSLNYLQTELTEVRHRQEKAIRIEKEKKFNDLARRQYMENHPDMGEAYIDEAGEDFMEVLAKVTDINEAWVEADLTQKMKQEVYEGVACHGVLQQDMAHALHAYPDAIKILNQVKNDKHRSREDGFAQLDSDLDTDVRLMRTMMSEIYREKLIEHFLKHKSRKFDLDESALKRILESYRDRQLANRLKDFKAQDKSNGARRLAEMLDARVYERKAFEDTGGLNGANLDQRSLAIMRSYYDLSKGTKEEREFALKFLRNSIGFENLYASLERWIYREKFAIDDLFSQAKLLAEEVRTRILEDRGELKTQSFEEEQKAKEEAAGLKRAGKRKGHNHSRIKIQPTAGEPTDVVVASMQSLGASIETAAPRQETDAEKRMREFKGRGKKKTPLVDLDSALKVAAEEIENGTHWKVVVETRVRRMIREAIMVSSDPQWHSNDIPKCAPKDLMDFGTRRHGWDEEKLQMAKRFKAIAFEKVVAGKSDKTGAAARFLKATMQFLNKQSILQRVREQTVTHWISKLKDHGYLVLEPGEEFNYMNFVQKNMGDPMVQWYLDMVHKVVEDEYTKAIGIFEDIKQLTKTRYPLAGVPADFGKKPVEDFKEGARGSNEKGCTRLVRLESILYTFHEVNPWLEKASPFAKIFDLWKNNSRIQNVNDPGPLRKHYDEAKRLWGEGQTLSQYKMSEQRWREVDGVLEDLKHLVEACDGAYTAVDVTADNEEIIDGKVKKVTPEEG